MPEGKMDKTAFSVASLGEDDYYAYWLSRSPLERLAAIEFMRRAMFGDDYDSQGLSRFFEVADLKGS